MRGRFLVRTVAVAVVARRGAVNGSVSCSGPGTRAAAATAAWWRERTARTVARAWS
ncbi:hypothetical protein [Streptomyces sp. NBC_01803]|uniref:hypothetical protein n=1 Tax=Streptomyces sp. NBC_01803 TaxID=2975946 RepID=UPI002DDB49E5|nr:hypothetical protein [Streptomyces sp. NBC_01803]WSA42823.1 hypothetical protein OIE51_00535 [Streptomyces sp. NBC_01803]